MISAIGGFFMIAIYRRATLFLALTLSLGAAQAQAQAHAANADRNADG